MTTINCYIDTKNFDTSHKKSTYIQIAFYYIENSVEKLYYKSCKYYFKYDYNDYSMAIMTLKEPIEYSKIVVYLYYKKKLYSYTFNSFNLDIGRLYLVLKNGEKQKSPIVTINENKSVMAKSNSCCNLL